MGRQSSHLKIGTIVSSFPVCVPFISFSCPITLAGSSSTKWNKSHENAHLCVVPDLRERTCSLLPPSTI